MVGVRLQPDLLDRIDAERANLSPRPSRPEMIRLAVADWLRGRGHLKP
jgi:hypothetical protein